MSSTCPTYWIWFTRPFGGRFTQALSMHELYPEIWADELRFKPVFSGELILDSYPTNLARSAQDLREARRLPVFVI
jgi:hypothetical protein